MPPIAAVPPINMARKIGVLGTRQSGEPRTYVKRAVASVLIRRLLAEWVVDNVTIRMLEVRNPLRASEFVPRPPKPYIPESMPPIIDKMLGIKFDDPVKSPNMPRFRFVSPMEKYRQPLIQV